MDSPQLDVKIQSNVSDDIHQLVMLAMHNTVACALLYFPHHFERDFGPLHKEFFGVLDTNEKKRKAVAAPRGFGKTTSYLLAYHARVALYGWKKFGVLISSAKDHSIEQLSTFKEEMSSNDMISYVFGPQEGPLWREDRITMQNGYHCVAKGQGQQIRGTKYRNKRPDIIFCDDMEDMEMIESPERMIKYKKWFYGDVMRAGVRSGLDCEVGYIGTVLGESGLLPDLLLDSRWASVRLEAFDDNLVPTDPNFMNAEEIKELHDEYEEKGQLATLFREYRNLAITDKTRIFKKFFGYKPGDQMYLKVAAGIRNKTLPACVIVDPARVDAETRCQWGIGLIAFDTTYGMMYVHDVTVDWFDPEQGLTAAFEMADRAGIDKIFCEENSLNMWLTSVVRMVAFGRNNVYDVEPIKAVGDKKERIGRLAPLVKTGMIQFNMAVCPPLLAQLTSFPAGKLIDGADMLAHAIPISLLVGTWRASEPMSAGDDADFESYTNDVVEAEDWNIC